MGLPSNILEMEHQTFSISLVSGDPDISGGHNFEEGSSVMLGLRFTSMQSMDKKDTHWRNYSHSRIAEALIENNWYIYYQPYINLAGHLISSRDEDQLSVCAHICRYMCVHKEKKNQYHQAKAIDSYKWNDYFLLWRHDTGKNVRQRE